MTDAPVPESWRQIAEDLRRETETSKILELARRLNEELRKQDSPPSRGATEKTPSV